MADATYQRKTYRKQGGDEIVVAASGLLTVESGGEITIESGGTIDIESGGDLDVESGGDIDIESGGGLNIAAGGDVTFTSGGIVDYKTGTIFKDSTAGAEVTRNIFVEKVPFTGTASTAGSVFGWTAPASAAVIIHSVILDITTQSATAGCVLDVGTTTTSLTTKSDNLLDGLVATGTAAVGAKATIHDSGANGVVPRKLTAGKFVTCSATGTKATSLAGSAYISFTVV